MGDCGGMREWDSMGLGNKKDDTLVIGPMACVGSTGFFLGRASPLFRHHPCSVSSERWVSGIHIDESNFGDDEIYQLDQLHI